MRLGVGFGHSLRSDSGAFSFSESNGQRFEAAMYDLEKGAPRFLAIVWDKRRVLEDIYDICISGSIYELRNGKFSWGPLKKPY